MNVVALVERLQTLPEDKQIEVMDFVDYLVERFARPPSCQISEWSDQDFERLSLAQAMRGLENEEDLYSVADIKERWL